MDSRTFADMSDELDRVAGEQLNVKGKEYPTSDDRLSNFKDTARIADLLLGEREVRISAGVVALIFSLKHYIPLIKYSLGEDINSEEPIGKAADLVNYIKLTFAIGEDIQTEDGHHRAIELIDLYNAIQKYNKSQPQDATLLGLEPVMGHTDGIDNDVAKAVEFLDGEGMEKSKYVKVPGFVAAAGLTPEGTCTTCNNVPLNCVCGTPEG